LQQHYQEQLDSYKREIKSLQHADHPYYIGGGGGADADDKVDDDDPVHREHRAHDWAAGDDPSKVSFVITNICHSYR